MPDEKSPQEILELDDEVNRAHIEQAKPDVPMYIVVQDINSPTSGLSYAVARRSADGQFFSVVVPAGRDFEEHVWSWSLLIDAIHLRRKKDTNAIRRPPA